MCDIIKSFFSTKKWALWAWGGLSILMMSMWIQVSLTVMINEWYGGFYDLMQKSADYVNDPQVGIDLFYERLISFKIEDKSFLHKKHKNFDQDKFHIKLTIESSELKKVNSIEANRKIYDILKDEMNRSIHSLQIIIV